MVYYPGIGAATPDPAGPPEVVTPTILGSAVPKTNTTSHHNTDTLNYTVPSGTELLLLVIFYGQENVASTGETTPSSSVDGNFTLAVATPAFGGTGSDNRPIMACWYLMNPTAGIHNITYGRIATLSLECSAATAIALEGVDLADPIGAAQNLKVYGTPATSFSSSLTTEKTISLVVAWAAWMNGTNVLTATNGLTSIRTASTGGAATVDSTMMVASKVGPITPGSTAYGFSCTVSQEYAHGAVEIRGAG